MRRKATIRTLSIIIALTLIIIGFSVFSQRLLYNNSQQMKQSIETVERSIGSENWKQADNQLRQVSSKWSDVKDVWSALIDHQEIDNIDVTLERLQMLIRGRDTASALAEAAALRKYIVHIPEKEKPIPANIF